MSELKAHRFITTDELFHEANAGSLYYDKSEADKVIADLEVKFAAAQQVLRLNQPEALFSNLETMGRLSYEIDVTARRERHQKYKRCLAMAKACDKYAFALELQGQGRSTELLKRHNRAIERKYKWLAIAEKFKEAK